MHRQTGEEQSNNFDEDIGDGDQESMLRCPFIARLYRPHLLY